MKKGEVFNSNADIYESWFEENINILNSEVEAIKQLLPVDGNGIEIGVGTGIFASSLNISVGVEPSKEMRLKSAQKGIKVIQAYAEDLPIADDKYDYALMVTVDCFLDNITLAFKEIKRILKKNGVFIIAFIDKQTPLGQVYEQHKYNDRFYKTAEFHSATEIKELLAKTGFSIVAENQTIYSLENKMQEVKAGVGEGVFAVLKAKLR